MNAIFTIGYEGADPGDFIAILRQADVDVLLDVRELPISRRKGFSKTTLRQLLQDAGIEYLHDRRLGSPKPIRDELRRTGDLPGFFEKFDAYLDSQESVIVDLAGTMEGSVALMCYERDVNTCHRRSVATRLGRETGIQPFHLGVKKSAGKRHKEATVHTRQGLSATEPSVR